MVSVYALKGRNNMLATVCSALSGLGVFSPLVPRALPWAFLFQPFRLKSGWLGTPESVPLPSFKHLDSGK